MGEIKFTFDGTPEELYAELEKLFWRWCAENPHGLKCIEYEGRYYYLLPKPERQDDPGGNLWRIYYPAHSYRPLEDSALAEIDLVNMRAIDMARLQGRPQMETRRDEKGIIITVGLIKKRKTPITLEYGLNLWRDRVDQILDALGCQPDTDQQPMITKPVHATNQEFSAQSQLGESREESSPTQQAGQESVSGRQTEAIMVPGAPPAIGKGTDEEWNNTFDWFYRQSELRHIKELTDKVAAAEGTIYNHHAKYVHEFGKKPIPDEKSIFA